MLFFNQNINFNENETDSIMENPTHTFREMNLALQLKQKSHIRKTHAKKSHIKNCDELELAKEKSALFIKFILYEGNFFNICVLSQCKVY